jgi:hypothetical protein
MDPLLQQIVRLVFAALEKRGQGYLDTVWGFPGIEQEDLQSHAQFLAALIWSGGCPCGLPTCGHHHRLPEPEPATDPQALRGVVWTAVIGPWHGPDIRAGSLAQSMLYRLVLTGEYEMAIAPVEFRACPGPTCPAYEGDKCPRCRHGFNPVTDRAFDRDWLIIRGRYACRRRWRCPAGTGEQVHFYAQRRCQDGQHGPDQQHDHCPWQGCPGGNPQHPQRGTCLWVRQHLHDLPADQQSGGPDGAAQWEAVVAGTEAWRGSLPPARRAELEAQVPQNPIPVGARVTADDFAAWMTGRPPEVSEAEREGWQGSVAEAFAARDLDLPPGESTT